MNQVSRRDSGKRLAVRLAFVLKVGIYRGLGFTVLGLRFGFRVSGLGTKGYARA